MTVTRDHRQRALRVHYPEGCIWTRELAWVENGEGPIYPLLVRMAEAIAEAELRAVCPRCHGTGPEP